MACLRGRAPFVHWLSIDRGNGQLRYGRGLCSASLVLLEATLKIKGANNTMEYIDPRLEWLDKVVDVEVSQTGGSQVSQLHALQR